MVMDALRGYLQLASGLTEVTRQRAQQTAKALLQQTGAEHLTAGLTTKVSDLTDELVATSRSNRALLQAIVTNEVESAVARLGFVRTEEVTALARRVESLERDLATAGAPSAPRQATRKAATQPVRSPAAGSATAESRTGTTPAATRGTSTGGTAGSETAATGKATKKTAQKTGQKTAKQAAKKAVKQTASPVKAAKQPTAKRTRS